MPNRASAVNCDLFRLGALGIDLDFDFLADHQPAGLQHFIIGQTVLLAIELGFGMKTDAHIAPGIFDWTAQFDRQGDFLGGAVHCKIANQDGLIPFLSRSLALKCNRRVFLNVEEVCAAQILVPWRDPGIHALGLDRALGFRDALVVHDDGSRELRKLPLHVVYDQMADRKADGRVRGIDVVSVRRAEQDAAGQSKGDHCELGFEFHIKC